MRIVVAVLAAASMAGAARAEVVASAPGGFQSRHVSEIAAAPERVWAALLSLPKWWSPAHTYSGEAARLTLDAQPGGCFCERLKDGGGVLHATVVQVRPRALLRLTGGLGPLQGEGVAGAWSFELKAAGAGTTLTQTMTAGGYTPGGLDRLAGPVDGVLAEQQARLKAFVETGRP